MGEYADDQIYELERKWADTPRHVQEALLRKHGYAADRITKSNKTMPYTIAKVCVINATGEAPFQSAHGPLYSFMVTLSDGVCGKVNAKSQSGPAYSVGDAVGYEVTGNFQGTNKLKIDKKAAIGLPVPQTPNPTPSAALIPPKTAQLPSPTIQGARIEPRGDTIGMALKLAGDILMHNQRVKAEQIDLPSLSGHLWEVASAILEAGEGLRTGAKPDTDPF
jgi:hypothetical protein